MDARIFQLITSAVLVRDKPATQPLAIDHTSLLPWLRPAHFSTSTMHKHHLLRWTSKTALSMHAQA